MLTVGSLVGDSFRFALANLRAILAWALVQLLLGIASMIVMRPMMTAQLDTLRTGVRQFPPVAPLLLFMLLTVGVVVVVYAAAFRAVFRPGDRGLAYLRLGGEEAILFAAMVVLTIGSYVAIAVAMLVLIVIGVVIAAASHGGAIAYAAIATIAFLAGMIYVVVRLSLVAPLSFLRREIAIGPAWRLTRGHGWTLLGAYLLLWLLMTIVLLAVLLASSPAFATMLLHPGDPLATQQMMQAQLARAEGGITVAAVATMIASAIANAAIVALGGGMIAIATMRLLGDSGAPA